MRVVVCCGRAVAPGGEPLLGGLWALILPRSFYEDFPLPGRGWVSTLGPYNEHLIRDYGAPNLAMAVLLIASASLLERRLVQVALVSWLVFATPHLLFLLYFTLRSEDPNRNPR